MPPSAREGGLDLDTAYGVEAELVQLRRAAGRKTVGRKVGFANKAMWRVLKLQTLVWAHMYDDTVKYADEGQATLSLRRMVSPRIEPEVVFKLKSRTGVRRRCRHARCGGVGGARFRDKVAKLRCRIFEVGISYAGRTYAEGKKIGWRDGMHAVWCILKYNLIR